MSISDENLQNILFLELKYPVQVPTCKPGVVFFFVFFF